MVAALVCSSVAAAQPNTAPGKGHPSTCDGQSVVQHLKRAKRLLREAYESGPDKDLIAKAQAHRRCIRIAKVRKQIGEYRDKLKAQLEQREEADKLTPYGEWAIPEYIVECESHGDWGAYNASSGARGPYQFVGWDVPWPVDSESDKIAHHRMAAELWQGGAGASHWECA